MQIARSNDDRTTVAKLEGLLALFQPMALGERDTQHGRRLCVDTQTWTVDADGTPTDVGVVTVWNDVLIRLLAPNVGQLLAGRIERPGKAYIFTADLTDDEVARAEKAEWMLFPPTDGESF